MPFANLPKELLQAILHHAIAVRGVKRGLRLRLVNSMYISSTTIDAIGQGTSLTICTERFAAEVIDTIYTHRMLDGRFSQRLTPSQMPSMPPFTSLYIEYRIHNSDDSSVLYPRMGFLRRIARDVVAENASLQYDDCVRLLCRLISEGGAARVYQLFCPALSLPTAFYEGDEYYGE